MNTRKSFEERMYEEEMIKKIMNHIKEVEDEIIAEEEEILPVYIEVVPMENTQPAIQIPLHIPTKVIHPSMSIKEAQEIMKTGSYKLWVDNRNTFNNSW